MKLCKLTEIGIEHQIIEGRGGKEFKEEVCFFMLSVPVCLRDNVQTEKLNRKEGLKHHTMDFKHILCTVHCYLNAMFTVYKNTYDFLVA